MFETIGPNDKVTNPDGGGYLTIDAEEMKKNTTYYLFLWPASTEIAYTGLQNGEFALIYYAGLMYRDNGTELVAYQPYIANGADWDIYMPRIDNGTDWDMCP